MERTDRRDLRRQKSFSLESSGSSGYDGGLRLDRWEMSERITQSNSLGLLKHVATKIEKVFGISSSELNGYNLVRMLEELCDTALDRLTKRV